MLRNNKQTFKIRTLNESLIKYKIHIHGYTKYRIMQRNCNSRFTKLSTQ